MADDNQFLFPIPERSWRTFFAQKLHVIAAHPVCAFFFGLSCAALFGIWLSNGDLFVMIPIAVSGWIFATVGWYWAPGLTKLARAVWMVISAMVFIAATAAPYLHAHPGHKTPAGQTLNSQQSNPYLFVECSPLLGGWATVPASGKIYQLGLYPLKRAWGGWGYEISRPGASFQLPTEMSQFGGSSDRCVVTNYGLNPVFNVALSFHLSFLSATRLENGGSQSGEPVVGADGNWQVVIPKIDLGPSGNFEFFLYSASPNFVRVYLPNTATAISGDSQRPKSLDVRTSASQPLVFTPYWLGVVPHDPPHVGNNNAVVGEPVPKNKKSGKPPQIQGNCSGNTVNGSDNSQSNKCDSR